MDSPEADIGMMGSADLPEFIPPERVIRASAFVWRNGKLSGNWGDVFATGSVCDLPEVDVRATIRVWVHMLRRYGTQDVDAMLNELQNDEEALNASSQP